MSLTIYIIAFVMIVGIVGSITIFFNSNAKEINMASGASAEYNKFNLYMLEYTKNGSKITIPREYTKESKYITFSTDTEENQNFNTFVYLGNILYFNKIKLCENVEDFKVLKETASNGKDVLKTYININGTVYTTDYVMD